MNIQVIYASRTGCTKRLAEAIFRGLPGDHNTIHDLKDGIPEITGDIVLLGYWGMAGGPDPETKAFLSTVKGKAVGVFCTLGYYPDSDHGRNTLNTGFQLLKENNEIIGGFIGNGAVASYLKKSQGKEENAVPTEQKELRWEMIKNHPTDAECAMAAERFRERVTLYSRCKVLNIPFKSVI